MDCGARRRGEGRADCQDEWDGTEGTSFSFMQSGESTGGEGVLTLLFRCFTALGNEQIKYYLEGSGPSVAQVEDRLAKVVEELKNEWMEVEKNGLKLA